VILYIVLLLLRVGDLFPTLPYLLLLFCCWTCSLLRLLLFVPYIFTVVLPFVVTLLVCFIYMLIVAVVVVVRCCY